VPFVVDASILACWALDDESHPIAEKALATICNEEAISPCLLWFEIRNILVVNERRKRITEAESRAFLRRLNALRIAEDSNADEAEVLRMSRAHKLTVYDAAYLELSKRTGARLATLDDALLGAAIKEDVALLR
jgi:predicted nucleic acid-binding protein